jgi:O-antigen ligase
MFKRISINFSRFTLENTFADFGLFWIIFFSIFYQRIAPIGFLLLIISLFFNSQNVQIQSIKQVFQKGPSRWFILYYLLLVIGLIWSTDIPFGLSKLENKLTFLIFPFLYQICKFNFNFKQITNVLLLSIFLSLVSSNILAFLTIENQNALKWNLFEKLSNSKSFCWNMHRSYFSTYCNILVIIMFHRLISVDNSNNKFLPILGIFLGSLGVIQSLSKINILLLFLTFAVFLIVFFTKRFDWRKKLVFSGILLIASILIINNKAIQYRFNEIKESTSTIKFENNKTLQSSAIRLIMWNTSWEIWKESFLFGTGTGDYNTELTKRNFKKGNYGVAKEQLNSHNQFLNTGVQLGLIGVISLMMIFLSTIRNCYDTTWKIMVLVVFLVNFLVESFIESQAGIVLFCILTHILLNPTLKNEINRNNSLAEE